MSACTVRPPRRARPFRKSSSMTKANPVDAAALPLDQARGRRRGAARGEQIVDDEAAPPVDRVLVHLERVGAVLERVGLARGAVGQLARLAHRHEADAEPLGQRRAEDEAARLDADDQLGLVAPTTCSASRSVHRRNAGPSPSSGVTSLNRIPGLGNRARRGCARHERCEAVVQWSIGARKVAERVARDRVRSYLEVHVRRGGAAGLARARDAPGRARPARPRGTSSARLCA